MKKFKRNSSFLWKKTADETVVLDVEKGYVYELNETASAIWKHSTRFTTCNQIAEKMVKNYGVSTEIILKDVEDFVTVHKDLFLFEKA